MILFILVVRKFPPGVFLAANIIAGLVVTENKIFYVAPRSGSKIQLLLLLYYKTQAT